MGHPCETCKARFEMLERDIRRLRASIGVDPAEADEDDMREAVAHARRTGGRDFSQINAYLDRANAGRGENHG